MSEERKQRSGLFGGLFGLILFIYIILAVVDYFGVFIKGTYENNGSTIVLDYQGTMPEEEENITYRVVGKEIIFYKDNETIIVGTIQNGVISYYALETEINYYKDGDISLDKTQKSFVDYIRIAVSPLTELLYNIIK